MDYIHTLHSLFNTGFIEAYRNASTKKRRAVIPYLQAIHRRWYYATLVENTPLSPANLMESLSLYFGKGSAEYQVPVLKNPSKMTGLNVKILSYSIENHPIVDDLRTLVDYCTPHIDLCEKGCFSDKQALELAESLSLNDPHYSSFLMEIALWMKMFKKLPSLYVQRMELAKKGKDLLAKSNEQIFREIVGATISLSAFGLHQAMPLPEIVFTESFIRNLLTNPVTTDNIFDTVLGTIGFELDDFMNLVDDMPIPSSDSDSNDDSFLDKLANMQFPDMDIDPSDDFEGISDMAGNMTLMAGTFILGIVLDRFYFTPFGHFLRIIRPQYEVPFDFNTEMSGYIKVSSDPEESFIAFFAPCSRYSLTSLGLELFDLSPTEERFFDVNKYIFMDKMKDTVLASPETLETFIETAKMFSPLMMEEKMAGEVHTFRVRLESDKTKWVHMQVSENNTLEEFYREICDNFTHTIVKMNNNYSFFHDKVENRFAEYPSPSPLRSTRNNSSKKKPPRTADTPLSKLDFDHMKHMILATYNQSSHFDPKPNVLYFQIERLNIKNGDSEEDYPILVRCSTSLKELHLALFEAMDCNDDNIF